MSFKSLIFRSLLKNLKNYYLYVFALVFSVALYFAFVTLQYDPAMDVASGTIKGEAGIKAGSVLLVTIVAIFLIYANNLFIKRRGKEIGLYQLVGISKARIFRIISVENFILYFGSMIVGIFLGFSSSKLIMMILLKIIGIDEVAALTFSMEALIQTVVIFAAIYFIIAAINYVFIKRQRILSLFHATSKTEEKRYKVSILEIIIGILGLGLIIFGYYLSSQMFNGKYMFHLFLVMLLILGSVIVGTYFFYKGSVRFLFYLIRKKDNGYLSVNKVLSLSSIMFRMRSNSLLLTIVTTVSALAIGLLSLMYISYYSAEKQAKEFIVYDFSIPDRAHAKQFTDTLDEMGISYSVTEMDIFTAAVNGTNIIETDMDEMLAHDDLNIPLTFIPDTQVEGIDVSEDEAVLAKTHATIRTMMTFHTGNFTVLGTTDSYDLELIDIHDHYIIPLRLTNSGFPAVIVDEEMFQQIKNDPNPEVHNPFSVSIGVNIVDKADIVKSNEIFHSTGVSEWSGHESQLDHFIHQKQDMGFAMFVVGFLGLTFLITSGCILYFKQMDEGEQEKPSYSILRKLGYTKTELLNGIKIKQLFNFGIPLVVGLCHSYFAVKSGWFFFGTELWTPMIIVMVLYTLLYSIFGILSVMYYKKLIKDAL
ncbi:FtsX-like permease family protein [Ornithinibacillus halotolerans]|uniref:Bacitracin export permease protein BceB n=1 Tax=Ornithinibacillus halotolerans TaxID=1274357 RepID=A0A916WEM5_9BACI|nr:FtsX-like permease family protein [Ornithinibacillus halotolerans]GGA90871.1 bacitracin export permease protein BceB [Ornithinibacillus halotolerans]